MSATFLHTGDWQLGKPFAGVDDEQKCALLQQERLNVLDRIGEVASAHKVEFVLVAGDLFDSPSVTKYFVSGACSAIGRMTVPVFAIPGNHDHGGPGSVWEQKFFQEEARQLAPNLKVLLKPEPIEVGNAATADTSKILNYNSDMEYRRCGKTNWMVSAVCLGGHWKRVVSKSTSISTASPAA